MKNVIVSEYENKRWYRIAKLIYIALFIIILVIANLIVFDGFEFWTFIITNLVIISFFGIIEGSFWYIARGKWGYPKDLEYGDLEKTINDSLLTKGDLLNIEETINWNAIQIGDNFLVSLPQDTQNTEKENSYFVKFANQDIIVDFEEINLESRVDGTESYKRLIDKYFRETLSDLISFGVKKENIIFLVNKIINTDLIWYRASISLKEKVDGLPLVFDDINIGDKLVKDFVASKISKNNHIFEFTYRYNDKSDCKQITKTINSITNSLKS